MSIPPEKLQRVFRILLEHVSGEEGEVGVEGDYFWSVAPRDVYDLEREPMELTVGQLTESWSNLERMLSGDSPVVGSGLVWLGDVLRAIGHRNIR